MLKAFLVTPETFPSEREGSCPRVALAPTSLHPQAEGIRSRIPKLEVPQLHNKPDHSCCGLEWQWLCRSPACCELFQDISSVFHSQPTKKRSPPLVLLSGLAREHQPGQGTSPEAGAGCQELSSIFPLFRELLCLGGLSADSRFRQQSQR